MGGKGYPVAEKNRRPFIFSEIGSPPPPSLVKDPKDDGGHTLRDTMPRLVLGVHWDHQVWG